MIAKRIVIVSLATVCFLRSSAAPLAWPVTSLPEMRTRANRPFLSTVDAFGLKRPFRPGVVLVRFKDNAQPVAVLTARGSEIAIQRDLSRRGDIQYAELDFVLTRQFQPNDPALGEQWHHAKIHSTNAWSVNLGGPVVTIAILDTPFQMNHPDLAANTVPGWSMITQAAITSDPVGYYHSTIGAGMAAAIINNGVGVSGVANCRLMPIDIGDRPTASDMHDAVIWAADHGVRVVNLSWDGAFSSVINDAGLYLKQKAGGMLFMSGVNGNGLLNYPNQPDIYAVSMTDMNDQTRRLTVITSISPRPVFKFIRPRPTAATKSIPGRVTPRP
ncbi:MAG TPA: S8 family serine peptidase [Verrucomicrobiae bacterium]|jgi:subtilisin family serine protease|nr:S8 family serine peptidase [Verrucomicrobiae bacterium]